MDEKALLQAIGKMMEVQKQEMSQMMDENLNPIQSEIGAINARLDALQDDVTALKADVSGLKDDVAELKDDVDELKEYSEITRDGVNTLISWADDVACVVKIPLKAAN